MFSESHNDFQSSEIRRRARCHEWDLNVTPHLVDRAVLPDDGLSEACAFSIEVGGLNLNKVPDVLTLGHDEDWKRRERSEHHLSTVASQRVRQSPSHS